jgi:ABC-type branched-subunit amino acid transport system substrate-binding protein
MNKYFPYKIGIINDWFCPSVGRDFIDALRLSIKEVVGAHQLERNLELVEIRVDGESHAAVQGAMTQLSENTEVLAITGLSGAQANSETGAIADEGWLPTIACSGLRSWSGNHRYCVAVAMAADEGFIALKHLQSLSRKSVAIVSDTSTYAREAIEFARQSAVILRSRIASEQILTSCAKADYAEVIAAAKAGGADSLALFCNVKNIDAVISGLGGAGLDTAALPAIAGSSWAEYQASSIDRTPYADSWLGIDRKASENKLFQAFTKKFEAEYGREAVHSYASIGYDIGRTLCTAIGAARPDYRNGLNEALQTIRRLPTATGMETNHIGFFPYDRVGLKGARAAVVDAKGIRVSGLR